MVEWWLMAWTTREPSYLIVLRIVISVVPISSTSKSTWLLTSHTLSILSEAALLRTKCGGATIDPPGTIYILLVDLITWMNVLIHSSELCGSLYFVGITTAYSWGSELNTDCWVLHHGDNVNIVLPACKSLWNWQIWFGGVHLTYSTAKERTLPWKVLSRSLAVYWTQMSWDSGMIPWLALVYSTLQSSPRCSTHIGQWNGWR